MKDRGRVAGTLAVSLLAATLCGAQASNGQTPAQPQSATQDQPSAAPKDTVHPEFRFLSTSKVSTMEKELNDLAGQGFRVERVSKSVLGNELAAIVASQATLARRYEYKMIATRRVATMEKEITEAASQGFELRGLISLLRMGMSMLTQGDETAALMERQLGETARRFEYKLLSTRLEKTMQKELNGATTDGFAPVEIILGEDNGAKSLLFPQLVFTTILARPANYSGAKTNAIEYKFLRTARVGSMEREMNQAGKEGFRYCNSSPPLLVLMCRPVGSTGATPYQYKLLATHKTGTMKKELSEHSALGYRYLATTSGLGGLTMILETEAAAEPKPQRHEYKLLANSGERTMQKEIADAIASGYQIIDLTNTGEFIVVLVRQGDSLTTSPKR